ncbi:MAG: hypothetical protein LIO87_09195 [Eubacterium sp.]|nr:hypothetical protein [Eubacterium sp.]
MTYIEKVMETFPEASIATVIGTLCPFVLFGHAELFTTIADENGKKKEKCKFDNECVKCWCREIEEVKKTKKAEEIIIELLMRQKEVGR